MAKDFNQIARQIDEHIRLGHTETAKNQILIASRATLKRDEKLVLASLARRIHLPQTTVTLLHPIVRPQKILCTATEEEKAVYAGGLIQLGAVTEAQSILGQLAENGHATSTLYLAYSYISTWEYGKAEEILRGYIQRPDLDPYGRMIAKINFASALVHESHFEEAIPLLLELYEETQNENFSLLFGNVLKLLAEAEVESGDYKAATDYLKKAQDLLATSSHLDAFFIQKWKAISSFRQCPTQSKDSLFEIRSLALRKKHWETVRDIDFQLAVYAGDREAMERVYFGTPYPHFRERLLAKLENWQPPSRYEWQISERGPGEAVPLLSGYSEQIKFPLKEGMAMHRLLNALCSDFYRPLRVAELFSKVFPGEHFIPGHAPLRIHQLHFRLRNWFYDNKLPVQIIEENKTYQLRSSGPFSVLLMYSDREKSDRTKASLDRLREVVSTPFTLREASQSLQVSNSSILRLVHSGIKQGRIARSGISRSTRYVFVDGDPKQAA